MSSIADYQPDLEEAGQVIVEETRKGYKTTEFWVTIAASLLVWLDGVPLPEKVEGYVVGAIGLAYIISRGLAKKGVANVSFPSSA